MEVVLFNILDFFHFRHELMNIMNLSFCKILKMHLHKNYIFYVKSINGKFAILTTIKSDDYYFYVSDIYRFYNQKINIPHKPFIKKYKFSYNSITQTDTLNDLGFKKIFSNEILRIDVNSIEFELSNYTFEKLDIDKNAHIRCEIQNEVFNEEGRYPLKVKDVRYEFSKKCFIEDLAYFIKIDSNYIGYGQILFLKGKYTVVNLCIKEEFRFQGAGRALLKYLLKKAKNLGINQVFIKVNSDNAPAKKLYTDIGFKVINVDNIFEI